MCYDPVIIARRYASSWPAMDVVSIFPFDVRLIGRSIDRARGTRGEQEGRGWVDFTPRASNSESNPRHTHDARSVTSSLFEMTTRGNEQLRTLRVVRIMRLIKLARLSQLARMGGVLAITSQYIVLVKFALLMIFLMHWVATCCAPRVRPARDCQDITVSSRRATTTAIISATGRVCVLPDRAAQERHRSYELARQR
jgi:hypothetical protein